MLIDPWKEQDSLQRKRDILLTDIRILIQHVQTITNPPRLDDDRAQLEVQSKGSLCHWQPHFHPCTVPIALEDYAQAH